jgi:hypothetical protein
MPNIDNQTVKANLAKAKTQVNPQQRIKDNLLNWFLNEQPSADDVEITAGSLRQNSHNPACWEASVQTFVYLPKGPKVHNSRVYFFVDSRHNIIKHNVNFKIV